MATSSAQHATRSESAHRSYKSNIKRHLKPFFGRYELTAITPEDVQQYVSQKKRGKLAPQPIKNTLVPLKEMLKHAVRWGYLRESPALYIEVPKVSHYEMDFMTVEEIHIFLNHVPQNWYALFLTAVMTCMRRGELLAMKWSNIDWNREQYFVREALYRKSLVEPKSATSRRAINLSPTLMDSLRAHRARQNEEKLILGPGLPGSRPGVLP